MVAYIYTASVPTTSLASRPTLPLLINFKTSGTTINILKEIGTNYSALGPLLLNDNSGEVIKAIVSEHQRNVDAINQEILTRWLKGSGKQPVAWSTLIEVLKDVELLELAEMIKKQWNLVNETPFPDPTSTCGTPPEVQLPHISEIVNGPLCPSQYIFFSTAVHKGMAYYANVHGIHEFDVHQRKWTNKIRCQQAFFGMGVIEDELTIVGGVTVIESGESEKKFDVETKEVACWPLSVSSQQKSWHNKYPAMRTALIFPQVVVANKYLIALGGRTEMRNDIICNPTTSVQILDVEEKRWYSNDRIRLPQVFTTMMWQSACIWNNDLFIAVEHDDPMYDDTKEELIENESTDSYGEHDPELDAKLPEPYPCFSMYCCSVETLVRMAKDQCNDGYCWQELPHPHPSVYRNPLNIPRVVLRMPPDEVLFYDEEDIEYYHQTDFFHYGKCCFTLSCIKNKMIAVGCKHVESKTATDIQSSLRSAYVSCRLISRLEHCYHDDMHICDDRESSEECYIHCYDIKKNSWKLIGSIPENGSHNSQPSVAVVDNKIIVMRNSETVHICTID